MKRRRRIGDHDIVVECSDELVEQAMSLLDKIEEFNRRGPPLKDGSTIQFGWSRLTLRQQGAELVVYEPGFGTPEPDANLVQSVNKTLEILVEQASLVNKLGVATTLNVDYRDKVVIAKGVFNCGHLYMLRGAKTSPDDSGWFIGDAEDTDRKKSEEDLESIRVYQLIDYPYLMSALTLPTGFLVLFVTSILESVTDANNHDIYSVYS